MEGAEAGHDVCEAVVEGEAEEPAGRDHHDRGYQGLNDDGHLWHVRSLTICLMMCGQAQVVPSSGNI